MTQLMDVTLRDGSYAINFQFSDYDTETLCREMEQSGFEYIEVGHGIGLNASSEKNGVALCSDEEYLGAAQRGLKKAKYGMFCIPGTARLQDLDLLKKYGASFVRVGTNANEVEKSEDFIRYAKKLGFEVMANYMKSYVIDPAEFRRNAVKSISYGADVIYIVDSAGSMDMHTIKKYYDAVADIEGIKLGFHGHNNLGLAVANSLYAVELGFAFIDVSLMGMGRSAGNASAEMVVANFLRNGIETPYNCKRMLECADQYIKPLYKHKNNAIDAYCGIAEFHTSYLKYIRKYAVMYRVNPLDLILAYSKYDKVNLDEDKLREIAQQLPRDIECNMIRYGFNEYFGNEQK